MDPYIVRAIQDEDEDMQPQNKFYKSGKLLGKLYRRVDEREIWHGSVRQRGYVSPMSFWDNFIRSCVVRCRDLGVPVKWSHRSEEAKGIHTA